MTILDRSDGKRQIGDWEEGLCSELAASGTLHTEERKRKRGVERGKKMNIFRIILILLCFFFWLSPNAFSAELYGQVVYRDGRPARNVELFISGREEPIRTDRSGFYSIELERGVYTLSIGENRKEIFLSPKGTRVDFRIDRQ